ncbi:3-deoxy-D-manno-octulosonic acid transferase [Paracoccus fistulariae]|uniref:3-deoxy-D-manno-octulosonic acid transferase n=1 Tax=Paracoccus fistulariae TaxID=658446 RepID=A0ABY7SRH3_9RHOB|nr:glycosyltransferase N-terminal domain-containing protein [Paracoccus fistulariae]MDB6182346.1 3-deoxy-D-manno-octulosonic acid transferase [Paracoccus fistulariae]WCR08676.1 3-deoxy-D-manno-octulosonic acid transferase [Paracoccus fistulariae]
MTTARWSIGRFALWLKLRQPGAADQPFSLPKGDGPLLLVHSTPQAAVALTQVSRQLLQARPNLRLMQIGHENLPQPGRNLAAAQALIAAARPAALLLLGPRLPAALITAASDSGIPIVLAEARLDASFTGWSLRGALRRELLRKMDTVLATDQGSYHIARSIGISRDRLSMTGPVAEIREPLSCVEDERSYFAGLLRGRHAWLAASVPPEEEAAVLRAHRAALHQSHRALLFMAPRDPARIDALTEEIEASGLIVARRTEDEEPTDEVQVMLTDGPTEMGLWYRLAPVTYMGGTLLGPDGESHHPFEPAALGSAIVHGPLPGAHATEWQQLQGAKASRQVSDANDLSTAIAELTLPEHIATLASNAWLVSTGGADVTMRICAPILKILGKEPT